MFFRKKQVEQTEKKMDLSSEIEKAISIKVKEETRIVKLRSKSCCGCGCSEVTVLRTVPADSKLRDGQSIRFDDILDTDEVIY
jgi:hypothetical protein